MNDPDPIPELSPMSDEDIEKHLGTGVDRCTAILSELTNTFHDPALAHEFVRTILTASAFNVALAQREALKKFQSENP